MNEDIMQKLVGWLVVLPDRRGRMVDEIGLEGMENALPSL